MYLNKKNKQKISLSSNFLVILTLIVISSTNYLLNKFLGMTNDGMVTIGFA
jgi:helix-turn-helix protein